MDLTTIIPSVLSKPVYVQIIAMTALILLNLGLSLYLAHRQGKVEWTALPDFAVNLATYAGVLLVMRIMVIASPSMFHTALEVIYNFVYATIIGKYVLQIFRKAIQCKIPIEKEIIDEIEKRLGDITPDTPAQVPAPVTNTVETQPAPEEGGN